MVDQSGIHTYAEIMSQGEVWQGLLESAAGQLKKVSSWLDRVHDEVLFVGCGSTYYLSLSAAGVWTELTHQRARGLPSSELLYYPASNMPREKTLLVAVSRSGETTETCRAVDFFRRSYKGEVLVICCYPDSFLAKNSKMKLLAPQAREKSVAQTRSFSSMFLLAEMLAASSARNDLFLDELGQLPDLFSIMIKEYEPLIRKLGMDPKYEHFVFLGSGSRYGLASEVMLKMKEMSTSISEVFHFMEFRHGPMSMIIDRSLVIGLVSDHARDEEYRVLRDMRALGASTLALANQGLAGEADFLIEFNAPISENARSVLFLPLMQLLGYYHSLAKGLDPDRPTNLQSVITL